MKYNLIVCAAAALAACAQPDLISLDDIRVPAGSLPGYDTIINCDRAPRYVFDKNGEIVDTIFPVLHPSCDATKAAEERRAVFNERRAEREAGRTKDDGDGDRTADTGDQGPIAGQPGDGTGTGDPGGGNGTPGAGNGGSGDPGSGGGHGGDDDDHGGHDDHGDVGSGGGAGPSKPDDDGGCNDPDSCHDHPDHDPHRHDNEHERQTIHGIFPDGS